MLGELKKRGIGITKAVSEAAKAFNVSESTLWGLFEKPQEVSLSDLIDAIASEKLREFM